MKKLVLTMIAMVTMSLSAMAQDTAQVRRQFNPEQMAKMRTDAVVKKYGLNEEQAKTASRTGTAWRWFQSRGNAKEYGGL